MKKIAIIPARSGSKGIKNKNIMELCGKPMIAYTIQAALEYGEFERVIVSTDSEKYGDISKKYGAEVMYREEKLANDTATSFMVIEDVLNKVGDILDYFVLLQPTSPLRNSHHIREAIKIFENGMSNYDFLVSVKEAEQVAALVKPIESDGSLKNFTDNFSDYRRQLYKEYSPNGAIFIGKPDIYMQRKHFFGEKSIAYKMNRIDSIDIDDMLDYELACICLKKMKGKK